MCYCIMVLLSLLYPLLPSTTFFFFFFNDTATTEIYTLSLHDALPITFSRNLRCPTIPESRKSPPSWKGPRNIRYIRKVSAPHCWMYVSGTTTLPRDFDILAPSFTIKPCARNFGYGLSKCSCPRSDNTMQIKREYNKCSTACSFPPM